MSTDLGMSTDARGELVRCASCAQANRIPRLSAGKRAVCGSCKAPLTSDAGPVELTDANFRSAIASGAYVVDFWAAWCGPCQMIGPVIEDLARARNDVRFAKLNVDQNRRTASAFGVQSIPLLIFFRDGAEKGRVMGAVPKVDIEDAIDRFLG